MGSCEQQPYCSDWQCPLCAGLNDWDTTGEGDQLCAVCLSVVEPEAPLEEQPVSTSSDGALC
eukprot:1848176-Amphidinium_carterae.1